MSNVIKNFIELLNKKDSYDYSKVDYPSLDCQEFKLTPVETSRYKMFRANHKHNDVNKGTIGGGISIIISPNSIGHCAKCKCDICGEIADITDIDSW